MKVHTTNYLDTFIEVAEDCPVSRAEVPPQKGNERTVANLQFDMLIENPYQYTSDEVLFHIYAMRNPISSEEIEQARQQFFSKGQPCFRSSPLAKRYGWGIHHNKEGKMAIYPIESEAYKKFSQDEKLIHTRAMRTTKKNTGR